MKLRQAPALDGMRWMTRGVQLLRAQPLTLAGLMGFMLFGLGLLLALPLVGAPLAAALLPALSAGWVQAIETLQAGRRPTPAALFLPFAAPSRRSIALLGGLHALAVAGMFLLAEWVDPDLSTAWRSAMSDGIEDEARLAAFQTLQSGVLLRMLMLVPVALVFWHAPVILARQGGSVARALFASALASFRNLGAFAVYGISWVAADLLLSLTLGGVLAMLGLAAWAMFFAIPAALFFSAAFYASLHATVHGCLDFGSDLPPREAA
ncbi:MAG: hypothetical protein L6Q75_19715 [Burkholderiaceae bacterium]|nr:hypothetical protein [Burkholderiaceae bacterium]